MGFELEGLSQVLPNLDKAVTDIAGAAVDAEGALATNAAEIAGRLAPTGGSGQLRAGIHAEGNEVKSEAKHSAAVEFGTATTPARPFFRPVLNQTRQQAVSIVVRTVREKV